MEAPLPSDRLLMLAFTLHQQSIASCGHYFDESFDGRGQWSVGSTVCAACAALERHKEHQEAPTPGEKVWAVNEVTTVLGKGELPPQLGLVDRPAVDDVR